MCSNRLTGGHTTGFEMKRHAHTLTNRRSGGRGLRGGGGFGGRFGDDGAAGRAFAAGLVGAEVEIAGLAESVSCIEMSFSLSPPQNQGSPRTYQKNRPKRNGRRIGGCDSIFYFGIRNPNKIEARSLSERPVMRDVKG